MAITEAGKKERLTGEYVWSSQLPKLFGIYGSPWDVYAEIIFGTKDLEGEQLQIGNDLEDAVLAFAERELNTKIQRVGASKSSPLASHLDGVTENLEPVEAKTAGILRGFAPYDQWGEPGTDEVPEYVTLQAHCHMVTLGEDICHVPALLAGRGYAMYHVLRDDELCAAIVTVAREFLKKHIKPRVGPVVDYPYWESAPSMDVLKRIRRDSSKSIELRDAEAVERYEKVKDMRTLVEKMEEAFKANLIAMLGDAESAILPDGRMLTYRKIKYKSYMVKASERPRFHIGKNKQVENLV